MNLILLGAPGAGKGTQSAKISEKYQIPAIATGDILRAERRAGTELGKEAQSYIDAGRLVPDSVVIGIIKKYMVENNCENGFILDGFPRSIPQAEVLEQMGIKIDAVLSIEVPDEKIVELAPAVHLIMLSTIPRSRRIFVTSAAMLSMSEQMTQQKL